VIHIDRSDIMSLKLLVHSDVVKIAVSFGIIRF